MEEVAGSEVTAPAPPTRRSLPARFLAALRLDASLYEEAEGDPGALVQAALVVALGGAARGVGFFPDEGWAGLFGSTVAGLLMWLVAACTIWAIGVVRLGGTSDYPELLRTLGFAAAPLVWLALCALPLGMVSTGIWWLAHGLAIVAMVAAIRAALDVTTERALLVCLLALGMGLVVLFVVGLLFVAPVLSTPSA